MMDRAQAKKKCFLNGGIGFVLCTVGLVEFIFGFLRSSYEQKVIIFSTFAANFVTSIWDLPLVPFLWQSAPIVNLNYLYDSSNLYFFFWIILCIIGSCFIGSAVKIYTTLATSRQQAQEERLKQERLGYPKTTSLRPVSINVSGTVHGHVIGDVSGSNVEVTYTYNDLTTIQALISDIYIYRKELPFSALQFNRFEAQLEQIQKQLSAHAPNHSLLRESLHTVRHMLEAGAAHMLVGHWGEIVHTLKGLLRG